MLESFGHGVMICYGISGYGTANYYKILRIVLTIIRGGGSSIGYTVNIVTVHLQWCAKLFGEKTKCWALAHLHGRSEGQLVQAPNRQAYDNEIMEATSKRRIEECHSGQATWTTLQASKGIWFMTRERGGIGSAMPYHANRILLFPHNHDTKSYTYGWW